jgi:hypothetical protein
MLTRRAILSGTAALFGARTPAVAASASAADAPSARGFVAAIYDSYKGKDSKGYPALTDERGIRRTFAPSLADLMIKDRRTASRHGDVGQLDFDPFIDGQDWEIAAFDIAMSDEAPTKATATITFTNAGTPTSVVLHLVRIGTAWRIDDIGWRHEGKTETLRGLYARR